MADQKLTQLTAITAPTADDLLYIVDDPAGTPASKKITVANAVRYSDANNNTYLGGNSSNSLTTGISNVTVGYDTGNALTTGDQNVIVGFSAGNLLTTGGNNTIIGNAAGTSIELGDTGNILIGSGADAAPGTSNVTVIGTTDITGSTIYGSMVIPAATTETRALTIGSGRAGDGVSSLDLVGDATYTTYGTQLFRNSGGANSYSSLNHRGTGYLYLCTQEAAPIVFRTTDTDRGAVASGGQFLWGDGVTAYATDQDTGTAFTPGVQTQGLTHANSSIGLFNWSSSAAIESLVTFSKSKSNVIGTPGAVAQNDIFGALCFNGDDGTAFIQGAKIDAIVDGAVGTNDMPGALRLWTTADGAQTSTERVRITNAGYVGIGTTSPIGQLSINPGDATNTFINLGSNTATASKYIGLNATATFGTSSGFSGIEFGGPSLAGEAQGYLAFHTHHVSISSGEAMRLTKDKQLIIGYTTEVATDFSDGNPYTPISQIHSAQTGGLGIFNWNTGAATAAIQTFSKSKSGTVGTFGIVASGDILGAINFTGDDGDEFITAAVIKAEVDGTPGASDMPGRLVFSTTADGAQTSTERMRISSTGAITVPGTLSVTGGIDAGANGTFLLKKVLSIGDWNMDSTANVAVAHGLTLSKIRSCSVVIYDDSSTLLYEFPYSDAGAVQGFEYMDATNVNLARTSPGVFDSTSFDATSFNRGFIVLEYIP